MSSGHRLTLSASARWDSRFLVWIALCVASFTSARPITTEPNVDLTPTRQREVLPATTSPLLTYLTPKHPTLVPVTTIATTDDGFKPSTTGPSLEQSFGDESKDMLDASTPAPDGVRIASSTTTTATAKSLQEENTVSFLALISIVAFVVIIFVTCLLVAAICPRGPCYFLQPLSPFRYANSSHFGFQRQTSQTPSSTSLPPLHQSQLNLQQQQQQIRRYIANSENYEPRTQNMNESVSSELESAQSENGVDFCCLRFQTLSGRNGHLSVNDSSATGNVPGVDIGAKDNTVQKYRKLTRISSDATTIREVEQASSSERVSVAESDSDNLSKDFCLAKRKRPYRVNRQRQRLEDRVIPDEKEINIPRDYIGVRIDKYDRADRSFPRPEYFISQCPYCSCDNLMVNRSGRGLDLVALHNVSGSGKSLNEDSHLKRTVL